MSPVKTLRANLQGRMLTATLGTLLGAGACAERRSLTWEDASPTHATFAPRAQGGPERREREAGADHAHKASTGKTEARRQPAPVADEVVVQDAGAAIDHALMRFRGERIGTTHIPRNASRHGDIWLRVLHEIDRAVLAPPTARDLGAFVRARVTLEVERQLDRERRTALPLDIDQRIEFTLQEVDARVNELRVSGELGPFRPAPPLQDGVLVLGSPMYPLSITSTFGVRRDPFHGHRRFHAGIDVGAPEGSEVFSAAPGIVIFAGWQGSFGRHVVVDHGLGIRTHYSHLSAIHVRSGQILDAGQALGQVGSTGRSTGPHLHFAVTDASGTYLDPLRVLGVPFREEVYSRAAPHVRPGHKRAQAQSALARARSSR